MSHLSWNHAVKCEFYFSHDFSSGLRRRRRVVVERAAVVGQSGRVVEWHGVPPGLVWLRFVVTAASGRLRDNFLAVENVFLRLENNVRRVKHFVLPLAGHFRRG